MKFLVSVHYQHQHLTCLFLMTVCITRKQTQNVFKWLRKGRQMTSLSAYMQHLGVSKNGGKIPIETLQLFLKDTNMPSVKISQKPR